MNLSKIIKMQKELDSAFARSISTDDKNHLNLKRIIAILVEIGEFANEYASFKYWKKQKQIDKNKLVEEFVDGIHFFATFIYKYDIQDLTFDHKIISQDLNIQLAHTYKSTVALIDNISQDSLRHAVEIYLGNAKLLKITNEEIEKHYIAKNKVNYQRIKDGY